MGFFIPIWSSFCSFVSTATGTSHSAAGTSHSAADSGSYTAPSSATTLDTSHSLLNSTTGDITRRNSSWTASATVCATSSIKPQ